MVEKVELGIRQISVPNEVLSLLGIMDMTFMNMGRRMILNIQGIDILLNQGDQISLPSGHGRIYNDQHVRIKEPEVSAINRTYYSHPLINGGTETPVREEVYSAEYHAHTENIQQQNTNIQNYKLQLETLLIQNNLSLIPGVLGTLTPITNESVWDSPTKFGLTAHFSLQNRWESYNNIFHSSLQINYAKGWFAQLTYHKVQFLRQELTNTADPNSIISKLQAAGDISSFDGLIGGNMILIDTTASALEQEHTTIIGNRTAAESSILASTTFINEWEADITEVVRCYEIVDGVEIEINPNATVLPINIKIIYTKEAQDVVRTDRK